MLPRHFHLTGASGSGTTTLGRALAERLGYAHLDTDDFYWLPTDPPYQASRPIGERLGLLGERLDAAERWVLSGSLAGWGDPLIPRFDAVVFLAVPAKLRMARLRARERARYGAAIDPGGPRHAASEAFLVWAEAYDEGDHTIRSRSRHDLWLRQLPCPVIRMEDADTVAVRLRRLLVLWGAS